MTPGNSLSGSTETSRRRSSVAETVGTHAPRPVMCIGGSSPMMGLSLTSLGQARTSPQRRPCCMAFRRPRRPRIAAPVEKFTRYSSVRWHSKRKARCLDDANLTPASARPRYIPPRTRPFTRRRQATGSAPLSRYINVSAIAVTCAAPSTPAGAPMATKEKEPVAAIILDVADATTAARTGARVPACQALGPSADTSSTLRSPRGTNRPPIS